MPVYVPFIGHKEMVPLGTTLLCQHRTPPHTYCLFLTTFYGPLLSFSLPKPHPSADPKTITFLKLLLAFPDLLPQAQKVTLLAGLVRAWLGPQPRMVGGGGVVLPVQQRPRAAQLLEGKGLRNPIPISWCIFQLSVAPTPWGWGQGEIQPGSPCLSFPCTGTVALIKEWGG